jgi:hypothetical protein
MELRGLATNGTLHYKQTGTAAVQNGVSYFLVHNGNLINTHGIFYMQLYISFFFKTCKRPTDNNKK